MSDLRYRTAPRGQPVKIEDDNTGDKVQRDHDKDEHDHDHDHDHEIDEVKLDNLLWEISKFCIPIGAFLWISIYLCYRHELLDWFTQTHPSRTYNPSRPLSRSAYTAVPSPADAPLPSAPAREGDEDLFDRWVEKETQVAWREMAANIGPGQGAGEGIVVAASSKGGWEDEPDYHYTWTRDAALTISTFLPRFLPDEYLRPWVHSTVNTSLPDSDEYPDHMIELLLRAYISSQAKIQTERNPSGDLWSGGLNEPKFHVDGSAFEGDWGRPQRDGPALRALTLIPYALFLLDRGYPADIAYVREHLYNPTKLRYPANVIKNDLEEVAGSWNQPGFDLWEEIHGDHLFTLLMSRRALPAGATLARRLNDTGAEDFYLEQSLHVSSRLVDFWDEDRGYWRASILHEDSTDQADDGIGAFKRKERSGLDCAVPLAVIHAGDHGMGDWSVADERMLSTLRSYILSFEGLYGIHKGKKWTDGWAVGRYAEDVYNGIGISKGNPWFICTFCVADMLYRARIAFAQNGQIDITPTSAPFWSDVLGRQVDPTETRLDGMEAALARLGEVGDAFFREGSRWVSDEGRMSEQIDRSDGTQIGARDLTWSYASFISAARARKQSRAVQIRWLDSA